MKITNVTATVLRLPNISDAADGTQDDLIITVETDEGITGYGEVDTAPFVGKAVVDAYMSHGTCYGLREVVVGSDPFDYEQIWNNMWAKTYYYGRFGPVMHVMSGIDMAIWDIMGKAVGKPVHKLLGGSYADKARAYASALMPENADEVTRMVEKHAALGYTALKFGWGPLGYDVHFDISLIKAARKAAGDKMDIMIDIGKRYRLKEAIYVAKALEQLNIYWLEEALPAEDYTGYKKLTEATTLRIATGEEESGRLAFARLINETHVDVIQPDMSRCGGLTEAKKIATMAADKNILCVPHAFKTGILVAASIHLIAAVPNAPVLEFSVTESPIRKGILETPFELKDGYVSVPTAPGLGITLNQEVIDKYGVSM
ncbi:mandelate racemase/muconate lactonizing enzyme family protein [Danxiaibacter flavus]|uniref:Mandelate racemase/muconate lactonizing enzyme family protein n=1 Tax=Danxiaibacter flavus TaxID=3049108 RepID=A0ABV3ZJA6_9BACT|nr:mandelate racemase/muconate lactonizing enzyme family protein [Chitinophagaceae bacterium DXS]